MNILQLSKNEVSSGMSTLHDLSAGCDAAAFFNLSRNNSLSVNSCTSIVYASALGKPSLSLGGIFGVSII